MPLNGRARDLSIRIVRHFVHLMSTALSPIASRIAGVSISPRAPAVRYDSGNLTRPAGVHSGMKKSLSRSIFDWVKSIAAGFAIFLVVRAFILQTWVITSGSMEGTLLVGDLLILNKVAYGAAVPGTHFKLPGYTDPKHRDIVVFAAQHDTLDVIKRLIGLPGDTLEMRDGVLFINSARQEEPYVRHSDPAGNGTHPWMDWQFRYLTSN